MTMQQFAAKMRQEVHLSWKLVFGVLAWGMAISATTAVNTHQNAEQQKILDIRAASVVKLEVVAEQLQGEMKATTQFRTDTTSRLDRIEDKLDRALEK